MFWFKLWLSGSDSEVVMLYSCIGLDLSKRCEWKRFTKLIILFTPLPLWLLKSCSWNEGPQEQNWKWCIEKRELSQISPPIQGLSPVIEALCRRGR